MSFFEIDVAPQIEALLICSINGNKICGKYYGDSKDFATNEMRNKFEKAIIYKAYSAISQSDSYFTFM